MKKSLSLLSAFLGVLMLSACSVFGYNGVETAPYQVLEKEGALELRHYDRLVLVTTPMEKGMEDMNDPFYRLFGYISGKNKNAQKIPMTAPVFMDPDDQKTETMSFVLPKDFTKEHAPVPQDPKVRLEEITDYTAAVITFSGFLNPDTISRQKIVLEQWLDRKGFKTTGPAKAAGYNPPYTIPFLRRNEVLIPVTKE